jgi:hypothetical protein
MPWECASVADVEVIVLPPDAELVISPSSKVLVKGKVSVRHLPGFAGPPG